MIRIVGIVLISSLLCSCGNQSEPSVYDGAIVVKICMDGSHIYRLKDGRFWEGGLGSREVENAETVCATR